MQRLLLDLRNNGGGLLDQAIAVSDQFLAGGAAIVETRGRIGDAEQAFRAAGSHSPFGQPLVVLVNSGTASASEIVSGAIQDHDIGLVVGTPTWGKGLVQTVYSLSYGAGLALTTAKYYTPSGRLIQRDYKSYFDYYTRADVEPSGEGANAKKAPIGEEFATDLGRKVYGGGGITPDFEAEPNELAPPMQYLLARAAFFRTGCKNLYGGKLTIDVFIYPCARFPKGLGIEVTEQKVTGSGEHKMPHRVLSIAECLACAWDNCYRQS